MILLYLHYCLKIWYSNIHMNQSRSLSHDLYELRSELIYVICHYSYLLNVFDLKYYWPKNVSEKFVSNLFRSKLFIENYLRQIFFVFFLFKNFSTQIFFWQNLFLTSWQITRPSFSSDIIEEKDLSSHQTVDIGIIWCKLDI